jgi:hypothetical protein
MNAHASPSIEFYGDASLGGFLAALEPYADESLVLEYAGRTIQPGFHVTEVKAGAFVTLDCGGNPDHPKSRRSPVSGGLRIMHFHGHDAGSFTPWRSPGG